MKKIDKITFFGAIGLLLIFIIPLMVFQEKSNTIVNILFEFLTHKLGFLYLIMAVLCLGFGIWLTFGKFGKVKLGDKEEKPQFSTFAWVSMMFTAGIGIGVIILSFVEPIQMVEKPPFGIEPNSQSAYEYAHMIGQFVYGPSCWALYAVATAAICYSVYVKKKNKLSISLACDNVLGKQAKGFWGKVIDIFVMVGIVGGISTSLGMGVPVVAELAHELFHIPNNLFLHIGILVLWLLIFGTSVYLGLDKGIKNLSNFNMAVAIGFLVYVLIIGPTSMMMRLEINSIGLLLDNFVRLSFWTDPIANGGFPERWTKFYWAWWIAYMPMMALFVTKISKGRTIKQVVGGTILWGSLGSMFAYGIFGAYSLHLQRPHFNI